MSYARGLGDTSDGTSRRFSVGQRVTVKLEPVGLTTSNQAPVFAELDRTMSRLGLFNAPMILGWGGGARTPDLAGMVVYRATMKTANYTPREVAVMVQRAVRGMEQTLGVKRLAWINMTHELPTGSFVSSGSSTQPRELVTGTGGGSKIQPPAPPAPPGVPADDVPPVAPADTPAPPTPGTDTSPPRSPATSEENFFTRKVGGVPVWAIGAGVLVLGAGLVLVATRKKPAAMQANRRRSSRPRLRPNDRRWDMEQYYLGGVPQLEARRERQHRREMAAIDLWLDLTSARTDSRGAVHMPSPDDRMAAIELVRQAYPDVDLSSFGIRA